MFPRNRPPKTKHVHLLNPLDRLQDLDMFKAGGIHKQELKDGGAWIKKSMLWGEGALPRGTWDGRMW